MAEQAARLEEERARLEEAQRLADIARKKKERADRRRAIGDVARNGRKLGIELEVEIAAEAYDIALNLSRAGVDCVAEGYTHAVMECWKVVPDSSVDCGWEIVSPPMTYSQAAIEVPIMCRVLREMDAFPARTCGLHVHHEIKDLTVGAFKRLVNRWQTAQPHIDCMVAPHRRQGRTDWAGKFSSNELTALGGIKTLSEIGTCYVDRYRSLNVTAFQNYGTVEVRQHQSTLNDAEILAWIKFGQHMIEDAQRAKSLDRGSVAAADPVEMVNLIVPDGEAKEVLTSKIRNPVSVPDNPNARPRYSDYDEPEEDFYPDDSCNCFECREARGD